MSNLSELPPADQEAIGKTLLTLLKAFEDRDAEPLLGVYSNDADWVNAFGTVKRGRQEIVDYLRGLFCDTNFNRGELAGFGASQDQGQGLVGGGTLDRDNFSLRAGQRRDDGSWLIASEMFQDTNTEATYQQ
jgi:hypothetical protein